MSIANRGLTRLFVSRGSFPGPLGFFASIGPVGSRNMHSSAAVSEKYFKITRYAKPVDKRVFQAGDEAIGVRIPKQKKQFPDYEYETMFFKRQNRGLYGGLQRTASKTCSESGNKNLRTHKPNIVKTKLWSEALNKAIQTRVSTRVLKTVTKEGGLDNYLTKDKPARIKTMGLLGWKLRYEILEKKRLQSLPKKEKDGKLYQVYYVHGDGKNIIVGRNKLLKELFEFAKRDSYTPLEWNDFLHEYSHLNFEELVTKLEGYNFDFSAITA